MKKWYRSAPAKGVLVVLEHVFAVVLILCILWGAIYPGKEYIKAFDDGLESEYKNTKGFTEDMESAVTKALNSIMWAQAFETDGKYDKDKIVDIKEYYKDEKISGEDVNGFAYTLNDLVEMSYGNEYLEQSKIVVGEKTDGSYYYYTFEYFKELVNAGELNIYSSSNPDEDIVQYILEQMEYQNDIYGTNNDYGIYITDKTGQVLYTDAWSISGWRGETKNPQGALSVMEIANADAKWNGKLTEMYDMLETVSYQINEGVSAYQSTKEEYLEGNTNLTYLLADMKTEKVYTNQASRGNFEDLKNNIEEMKGLGKYIIAAPKLSDFKTNTTMEAKDFKSMLGYVVSNIVDEDYIFVAAVDTTYPVQDDFYSNNKLYEAYAPWMVPMLTFAVCSAVGGVLGLIWLTIITGRTRQGELKLMFIDRWKTEVWLGVMLGAFIFIYGATMSLYLQKPSSILTMETALLCCLAVAFVAVFLIAYLGFVRRIKAKSLWSNSILKQLIKLLKEVFNHRSCTFKTVAMFLGIVLLQFFVFMWTPLTVIALAADAWIFVFMVRGAIAKQKIKNGIERIAGGDVDYKIPLDGLRGENLDMAVRINNIGEGLNAAVEENLKNERLKTDLITNVSHDIKTPLTSIINYVDLLKRENFADPKIQSYLDVLDTKSQRLKHLTEDVVEASKISSGNIKLEFMNLNLIEMIHQTSGEFVEKFEQRKLSLVLNIPEEPAVIRADGRRMWRVLENVYNNAAKYAMEGTRIYADLTVKTRTVEFSLKNVSEQPLNISADELTERFIRGDVSRGTEGSGLGLSIAKNLVDLQGGRFDLYLDGDLFKVTISFPKVYQKAGKRGETEFQSNPQAQPEVQEPEELI